MRHSRFTVKFDFGCSRRGTTNEQHDNFATPRGLHAADSWLVAKGPSMEMDTSADGLVEEFAGLAPFPAATTGGAATPTQNMRAPTPAGTSANKELPPLAPNWTAKGRHWSGVEPGFPFRLEFEWGQPPKKLYANLERRHNGLSRSLEKDWPWLPEKPNGDSLSHALGKLLSKDAKVDGNGLAFRDRLLGKPVMKQMNAFFGPKAKPSTPAASTASFAPSPAPQSSEPPLTSSSAAGSHSSSESRGHPSASSTFPRSSGISVTPPAQSQTETGSTSRKRPFDTAEDVMGISLSQQFFATDAMSAREIDLPTTGPWQGCTGFQLPGLIEPVMANYPFAYHTSSTSWTPPGPDGRVFDIRCKGRRLVKVQVDDLHLDDAPATASCADCVKLVSNRSLANVLQRAADSMIARRPGMRDADLTMSQLHDRSQMHKERESLYRVTLFHKVRCFPTPTHAHYMRMHITCTGSCPLMATAACSLRATQTHEQTCRHRRRPRHLHPQQPSTAARVARPFGHFSGPSLAFSALYSTVLIQYQPPPPFLVAALAASALALAYLPLPLPLLLLLPIAA